MPGRQPAATHQQQLQLAARLGRPAARACRRSPARAGPPAAPRSVSSRSVIAHRSRSGAAVTPHRSRPWGRLAQRAQQRHPEPLRSRSCRPTGTHAALSARSASPAHDRSKTVFPLPGGADATVTGADASSRLNSPGRDTTLPGPGQVTGRQRHPMPGQGPWPDHHTKPAGIPNRRAVRSISAATDRRSLSSSASSTRRSGLAGLGQRRLPLAGMACEQSALYRRSKIWQRVTSVLLMLPLLSGLRRWPRLSRSGSPVRRPAVTAAWQSDLPGLLAEEPVSGRDEVACLSGSPRAGRVGVDPGWPGQQRLGHVPDCGQPVRAGEQ
jgi:hypothetical protein